MATFSRSLTEIIYEGLMWKQSYWMKSWRERWCVLTGSKQLHCFKEQHNYTEETETFDLINNYEIKLIKNFDNEIIFELINSSENTSRKFKIDNKKYMLFYSKIQRIMNKNDEIIQTDTHKAIPRANPTETKIPQTLICGYIRFNLKINQVVPATIIELLYKYTNPLKIGTLMAVFFKHNGLQFVPMSDDATTQNSSAVQMEINTISCHFPQYFKKWNLSKVETKELQAKYHQITYVSDIKHTKIPKLFCSHELFVELFGNSNNNLSLILTSYFSFIIFDALKLKAAMKNNINEKIKGIEFQLPNVENNYNELQYYKMCFSSKHGLIAYKDNDIYKLNINNCQRFDDVNVMLKWERIINFPMEISITSMCWLTENKLFLCGQSAIIMDVKKGKYHQLTNYNLDEFILFPTGIKYNFINNCVFVIGGSHQNGAQFYDISKSKWFEIKKTNYSHNGQNFAPIVWFDYYHPYLLYVCSFCDQKVMIERLDTRNIKNKWIECGSVHIAQYLDFKVWNFSICS